MPIKAKENAYAKFPLLLFMCVKYKKLSAYAKLAYMLFYNRNQLSKANPNLFSDLAGEPYINFSQKELREILDIAPKKAGAVYKELENAGLITRKRVGQGRPDKIYVVEVLASDGKKCTSNTVNSGVTGSGNMPGSDVSKKHMLYNSKIYKSDIDVVCGTTNDRNNRKSYGRYGNVQLSDLQHNCLVADYDEDIVTSYIDRVDSYCQQHKKRYKDCETTIRSWIEQDNTKSATMQGHKHTSYDLDEYEAYALNHNPLLDIEGDAKDGS